MSKKLIDKARRKAEHRVGKAICLTAAACAVISTAPLTMASSASAQTQTACGPRAAVLEALNKEYAEHTIGMGLDMNGNVVELFSHKDGESWTIVVTMPNGISCPVLGGVGWEKLPMQVAGHLS